MTIIFLNQFFWPDESATSLILNDCVREASRTGAKVKVVCSEGGYSELQSRTIDPGMSETVVHRVSTPRFARGRGISKLISYAVFFAGAAMHLLRSSSADEIVSMTTPPLLPVLGRLAQLIHGSQHVIWEMDVYPDVAVELGMFRKGSFLDRFIGMLADWPRHKADRIIVLGPCMKERLIQRGVSAERIVIAENWADGQAITPQPFQSNGPLRLLYSGNLGLAHEFETICGALAHFSGDKNFEFKFYGAGARKKELEDFCGSGQIGNCTFGPFQPIARLGEMLAGCDIGLVTQRAGTSGTVVPSKMYAILASGRPILYIGPASATAAKMIAESGCGWHIENGRVEELIELLGILQSNPRLVEEAGQRARTIFDRRYDLPLGVARILKVLYPAAHYCPRSSSTLAVESPDKALASAADQKGSVDG